MSFLRALELWLAMQAPNDLVWLGFQLGALVTLLCVAAGYALAIRSPRRG